MLKHENRLNNEKLIRALMNKGERYSSPFFLCKYFKKEEGVARFAIVVSKKVSKKAVERNRIKRRLSEAFRLNIDSFSPIDGVVFGSGRVLEADFSVIEKEISKLANYLNLTNRDNKAL